MTQLSAEIICKRYNKAWEVRRLWWEIHTDIFELILPNRNTFSQYTQGEKKMQNVYDSTPVMAAQKFVSRMQSGLTPPFERWFEMQAGPGTPEAEREERNIVLADDTEMILHTFNACNFYVSSTEAYHDLVAGTMAMLVLEGDVNKPVHYIAAPIADMALVEGPHGTIDEIYRNHKMERRLISRTWDDASDIPDANDGGAANDKGTKKEHLIEATYYDPDDKVWRYEVLLKKGKVKLVEREYKMNPWIIGRWSKMPGEVFGRGPGVIALPDVKTINKIMELTLKNAALAISSPYLVADDGVVNPDTVRMAPNALIRVARTGGTNGASIAPLETTRNFDVTQVILADHRDNIKRMFFDNQLPALSGPVKSATEIVERMKNLREDIGAAFGRLQNEWINPLIQRTAHILHKQGLVETDPLTINQFNVKVAVLSPLAKTQNFEDVQTVTQWLQLIATTLGPEALQTSANFDKIPTYLAEKLGVPSKLVSSKEERKDKLEAVEVESAEQLAAEAEGEKKERPEAQLRPVG